MDDPGSPGGGALVGVERIGTAAVAVLGSEVDLLSEPAAHAALDELVAAPEVELLVVDLSEVTFFSSRGLRMLVEVDDLAHAHRAGLRLVTGENRSVLRLLEITALDKTFELFDTRADALRVDSPATGGTSPSTGGPATGGPDGPGAEPPG